MKKLRYIEMLKSAYNSMHEKNPQFSMNAFARYLSISQSQLNEILKGKCGLSEHRARKIVNRLEFSELESQLFLLSVGANHSRSKSLQEKAQKALKILEKDASTQLRLETFSMVSSWYHFAILELLNLEDFEPDYKWLAKRLNVEVGLIKNAVQRLKKLELIKVVDGKWVRHNGIVETTNDIPSSSIKKYHSQILNLAERALFEVPVEKREYNSVFLAVDPSLINEAKKKIRAFQKKMIREFSRKSIKKEILVSLNVQLFPIGNPTE